MDAFSVDVTVPICFSFENSSAWEYEVVGDSPQPRPGEIRTTRRITNLIRLGWTSSHTKLPRYQGVLPGVIRGPTSLQNDPVNPAPTDDTLFHQSRDKLASRRSVLQATS